MHQPPDKTVSVSGDRAAELRERAYERGDYPRPVTEGRGRNMRAIKRAGTKPEVALRSALHAAGLRFRKDLRLDLGGPTKPRPDIVFTRAKVAIFVDGCFWHGCPEHSKRPTVNTGYWGPKLARNVERDRAYDAVLAEAGWTVIRVWEHEEIQQSVRRVRAVLEAAANTDA